MKTWQSQWDENERALAAHDAEAETYCGARAAQRAAWRKQHGDKVPYPAAFVGDVLPRRMYARHTRLCDQQEKLITTRPGAPS
jgi:hypothetical protein